MHKTSTSFSKQERGDEQRTATIKPKKSTVDLIKQFARIYAYNSLMPAGLEVFIAN